MRDNTNVFPWFQIPDELVKNLNTETVIIWCDISQHGTTDLCFIRIKIATVCQSREFPDNRFERPSFVTSNEAAAPEMPCLIMQRCQQESITPHKARETLEADNMTPSFLKKKCNFAILHTHSNFTLPNVCRDF
jgi:hypothetical protein